MRTFLKFLLASSVLWLASCASVPPVDPAIKSTLAPSGTLKVGVYKGSPTSWVHEKATGAPAGMAHDFGGQLARRLDVPVQVVFFDRLALVLDALKRGDVDMTFTNASPARQREFAFTQPLLSVELGYLTPKSGRLQDIEKVDVTGMRVGVAQGSSSQAALGAAYKNAREGAVVVAFASIDLAKDALRKNEIDAFATNKAILNEALDDLQATNAGQFHILAGRWGMEHMGVALPKERAAALPFVQQLGDQLKQSGVLTAMAARAGLRGIVEKE